MNSNDTLLSRWCNQAWLYCVYLLGILMTCVLLWNWTAWLSAEKLMCCLTIMFTLHVFEENSLPGGFPYMNNIGRKSEAPLVYPQNRLTNMWTNLGCTLLFTLLTFFTPRIAGPCITIIIFFGILIPFRMSAKVKSQRFAFKDKGYFSKFD